MAWDIESLGSGGIGGIFVGIITALGLKSKVDKLDDKKQDKSLCDAIHKSIDDKFTVLIEGQDKIWNRLDSLNDYVRNQK